jgi:eukaryotic-like serine/threonine-protein kinase
VSGPLPDPQRATPAGEQATPRAERTSPPAAETTPRRIFLGQLLGDSRARLNGDLERGEFPVGHAAALRIVPHQGRGLRLDALPRACASLTFPRLGRSICGSIRMSVAETLHDIGAKPGDVLAGKYQVERVLGIGGVGVVVAAHHVELDDKVALKFLLPQALKNAEAVARFVREARAAVRIKSEHVARVSDVGKLDNGAPYMVMEYLEGRDLAAMLEERGVLPPERAVELVLQACEAIAEAHGLGIVHRDLKPSNLFCVRRADGVLSVKVLDFGISKLTSPEGRKAKITHEDAVMGSPAYMSPEQMQASPEVDARTDIWALGVILFELLTGRVPFEGEVSTDLAIKIATMPTPSLQSARADVSVGLERVVMRCLEKDPALRFQNVGELAVALEPECPRRAKGSVERILRTVQTTVVSRRTPQEVSPGAPIVRMSGAPAPVASVPSALVRTVRGWRQPEAWTRGKRRARIGAGVVAGLAALAVAVAVLREKSNSESWPASVTATSAAPALPALGSPASPLSQAPSATSDPRARVPSVSLASLPAVPPTAPVLSATTGAVGHVRRASVAASSPPAPSRSVAPVSATKSTYNPLEHL